MSETGAVPYYWKSVDWDELTRRYPPPPAYGESNGRLSPDELRELQDERFLARVADGWKVAFYRDRWRAAGLEEGDVTCLEDIAKLPPFTSDDLKDAIASAPPFGSHHPIGRDDFGSMPLKVHTSGGTTGLPRPTLFDPIAWEVQGIQTARAFWAQGGRPGDVVQIPFTTSLANAGWSAFVAAFNWLGAVPLTTGSGKVTPSERQIEYASAWGTNFWYAMGEYMGRLTEVAASMDFDLRQLPTKFIHTFLGADTNDGLRHNLEEAWGAPVYDSYGAHEFGLIAFECDAQSGKHISEDTAYCELADVDSGEVVSDAEEGNLVVTSMYRSVPPIIRYNTRDLLRIYDRSECECGLCTRKLSSFLGRSDDMVKLRGQNIYPLSCQSVVQGDERAADYICVLTATGEGISRRESLTIRIERSGGEVEPESLHADLSRELDRVLGVRVEVEIVDRGALRADIYDHGEKARRLIDLRSSGQVPNGAGS